MFVLAIDTSSPAVTVGVLSVADQTSSVADELGAAAQDIVLVAERAPLAPRGHGELLTPCIGDCLHDAGLATGDLAAVVAGTGPGPFTGLRVGLVTATAFAHAIGVATYGVCSLDAIAAAAQDEGPLLVATDARRREVYWARYDEDGARIDGPHVSRPADVPLDGVTDIAGAGGELYTDAWPQLNRLPYRYPDPVSLVGLALERTRARAPSEPLTPLYLRRPDAVVPGAPKQVTSR